MGNGFPVSANIPIALSRHAGAMLIEFRCGRPTALQGYPRANPAPLTLHYLCLRGETPRNILTVGTPVGPRENFEIFR